MTLNPPHSDFILPGLRPLRKQYALHSAYTFAVSKLSNKRNLENPWYAFWGQISEALADHHSLLSIPQYRIWYKTGVKVIPEPKPVENIEDVGNTSLDTTTSFTPTIPEKNTKSVDPDFTIVHLDLQARGITVDFARLGTLKLRGTRIALVIENKRGGARTKAGITFPDIDLDTARFQCQSQAMHVFKMFPEQTHVIVIATAGHWWAFRDIARPNDTDLALWEVLYTTRVRRKRGRKGRASRSNQQQPDILQGLEEEAQGEVEGEDEEGEGSEEGDDEEGEGGGDDEGEENGKDTGLDDEEASRDDGESNSDDEGSDPEGEGATLDGQDNMDSNDILRPAHVKAQIADLAATVEELAPPSTEWSLAFEFGTPESNQRLWYLNSYLAGICSQE